MDDFQSFSRSSFLIFLLLLFIPWIARPQDLSEALKEASVLELQGHNAQALEAYLNVLAVPGGGQLPGPRLKAALLSLTLGHWETAQELAGPLVNSEDLSASQLGLVVMMRSLRETQMPRKAWDIFQDWQVKHPQCPLTWNLAREAFRCAESVPSVSLNEMNHLQEIIKTKSKGVSVYLQTGQAEALPLPPPVKYSHDHESPSVLQIGVFRNYQNAENEIQLLKKQGWKPQLKKSRQSGFDLYLVQILSRNVTLDIETLKAEGYEPYLRSERVASD